MIPLPCLDLCTEVGGSAMTLAPGIVEALADIVGRHYVRGGRARTDRREVAVGELPDAVVLPATTDEVAQVLRGAAACRLRVLSQEGTCCATAERARSSWPSRGSTT